MSIIELYALISQCQEEIDSRENQSVQSDSLSKELIELGISKYNAIEGDPEEKLRPTLKLDRGYLDRDTLLRINKWKNRTERNRHHFDKISDNDIIQITREAFSSPDDKTRLELLKDIPGIGYPTASAILMMYNPERYGVYDRRVTRVLHSLKETDTRLENGSLSDILQYYSLIRKFGKKYGKTVRDIDKALFGLDVLSGKTLD